MPFGVGHEAEDAPTEVANAGDVVFGAVGIDGIGSRIALGVHVTKDDLTGLMQAFQDPLFAANKSTFAMRHGYVQSFVIS